jgi:hypothetical protein
VTAKVLLFDRITNLIEEGIDVGLRVGQLPDSSLIARQVGEVRRILVASPAYLSKNGTPKDPTDLKRHSMIAFTGLLPNREWVFGEGKTTRRLMLKPRFEINDAAAAIAGAEGGGGNATAMANLGWMYANGTGVEKDDAEAVRWYRKAADKGEATAVANLGWRYANGQGVAKDPRQAAEWVFKAVKAGNDFSIKQMTENASAYTKQFRREFQRLMKEAGVYDGRIDGSFGPGTRRAIEALPAAG